MLKKFLADYWLLLVTLAIVAALAAVIITTERTYESDAWESETLPSLEFERNYQDGIPRPNSIKTPGAIWKPHATLKQLGTALYSKSVRDVPESEKKAVFARYGIPWEKHADYEVDHLIPLSWGGSNAVENLWPQLYAGDWGARTKDALEVHGLAMIRTGGLDLKAAQQEIADNWPAMHKRLLGPQPRAATIRDDEQ